VKSWLNTKTSLPLTVLDEHVPFLEGTGIEQHLQALARGKLALGVLRLDPAHPAAGAGRLAFLLQSPNNFVHGSSLSQPSFPRKKESGGDRSSFARTGVT
jgi:hypothetical protein